MPRDWLTGIEYQFVFREALPAAWEFFISLGVSGHGRGGKRCPAKPQFGMFLLVPELPEKRQFEQPRSAIRAKALLKAGADVHAEDDLALYVAKRDAHTKTAAVLEEAMQRQPQSLPQGPAVPRQG